MKLFQVALILGLGGMLTGCAAGTLVTRNGKDVRMTHDDIEQISTFKSDEVYASLPFSLSVLQFSIQLERQERDSDHSGGNTVIVYVLDNPSGGKLVPQVGTVTVFVASNGDRLKVSTREWRSRTLWGTHGYELLCNISDRDAVFFTKHQGEEIKVRVVADETGVLSADKVQALADFVTAVVPVPAVVEPFKPFDAGDSLEEKKRKFKEAIDKM